MTFARKAFRHIQISNVEGTPGTAEAAVVSWSTTTIVVTVPSLSPGTYPVDIEKDGEDACSGLDYPVL